MSKAKIVTEHEIELSTYELQGILIKHYAEQYSIPVSFDDTSRIELHRDKVILTITKREYKKK